MDFTIKRGEPYVEEFNFKAPDGRATNLNGMEFEIVLERGTWVHIIKAGAGMVVTSFSGKINVGMSADWTQDLPYSMFKYTLAFTFQGERKEVTSGMVTVI
jgi:lipoprotein-anchoring transpeptidase ErfK/SrfK